MTCGFMQPPGGFVLHQAPDCAEFITQICEGGKCQAQRADGWKREMESSRILARKDL